MSSAPVSPTYKGRILGIVVLAVAQFSIGSIHVFFGFWLLFATSHISAQSPVNLQHLHFGFWSADSLLCLWNLAWQKLGLAWHCCSFPVCYRRRCFDTSEFAQHPRHSKASCGSRNRLQSYSLVVSVSKTHQSPIQGL